MRLSCIEERVSKTEKKYLTGKTAESYFILKEKGQSSPRDSEQD